MSSAPEERVDALDPDPPADPPAEPVVEGEVADDDQVVEGEVVEGEVDVVEGEAEEVTFETLVADLERVAVERDQFLDAYRRAQADFENFKKQSQRRGEQEVQRRLGSFVERLLPVLDACDAARRHGAGAGAEVEPIVAALMLVLEKEGLERVDPAGEPFDPAVAEAVVHEPGSGGEQVVAEVLRAGYTFNGRVLRPAMVKVTD